MTTTMTPLQVTIGKPSAKHQAIAETILNDPRLIPEVIAGLTAQEARVKYGCLKVLRLASEQAPQALYPHFEQFTALLGSKSTILNWGAIIIIGNLAATDRDNKIDALLTTYLKPIRGPVMITAANTIGGAAKIARAKPYLSERIVSALLRVEEAKYETVECQNVALGHVLKALALIYSDGGAPKRVVDFAQRQLSNSRNAVKTSASKFLKKHTLT